MFHPGTGRARFARRASSRWETEYERDYTDQGYLAGGLEIQYSDDAHGNLTGYTVAEFNAAGVFTGWTSYDAHGQVIGTGDGKPNAGWDLPTGKTM